MPSSLLLLLSLAAARADVPMSVFPDCGEPERPDLCPSDLGEEWDLISWTPTSAQDSIVASEADLGSGVGLDRAVAVTAGRWDVRIAIGDSGIDWGSGDMWLKWFLNTGELPNPQDATGATASSHDLDGNGIVNAADYLSDPRIDPDAHPDGFPGVVDVGDIILAFSDGVDDDGNGYPDDISGWDFFEDDNDAYHRNDGNYGSHGSGVSKTAGAEGEGGGGSIGTCPGCAVIPVRVGDTFIIDGTRAGEAIVYAADMGAVAISQAIGAMSAPDSLEGAVQYAFESGMLVVGAAGDENQYHHNIPASLDDAFFVKSVRHDTGGVEGAGTFLTSRNCNNHGVRMTLVAPDEGCATGAVAKITGMVGMVHSAARDAGLELTAAEVSQILIQTADDVWLSEEEQEETRAWPSKEGWDIFHGYGRANVGRAVEAVAMGEIPPVARLTSPRWFEAFTGGALEVSGEVLAPRSSVASWRLEWGRGGEPEVWEVVAEGAGETSGVLGSLDLDALEVIQTPEPPRDEVVVERHERVHAPGLTLRLFVTDAEGREGEARKHVHLHRDAALVDGFPLDLGASLEASPVVAELDGARGFELVVATSAGEVHILRGDGSALPGWPVSTDRLDRPWSQVAPAYVSGGVPAPRESVVATPAVGDLDGDGVDEIVVATLEGRVWAWHLDGTLVEGFPYDQLGRDPEELDADHTWDRGFMGAPTLADVDGSGTLEVIIGGGDGYLYVVEHTGEAFGEYPVELCHPTVCGVAGARIISSPTVDDVDGDGDLDVLIGSNEGAYGGNEVVTHGVEARSGVALPGFPWSSQGLIAEALLLPLVGEGHPASVAVADLDGDGDLELLDPIMLGQTDLVHHDGEVHAELSYLEPDFHSGNNTADSPSVIQLSTHPAFGDLDQDGIPDAVIGGSSSLWVASLAAVGEFSGQHPVAAWSGADGSYLPGWPRQIEDLQFLMAPAIADVSGDGMPEVIYASAGNLVHAWDGSGVEAEGWPKNTGQWIMGSPAVADLTGDGWLEVVVTTREGAVWVWTTQGRADQAVQWQSIHHDARNTGSYQTPLPSQEGPAEDGETETDPVELRHCFGCGSGSGDTGAALLLLPGLFLLRRRR